MKKYAVIFAFLVLLSFAISLYFYPGMPDSVAMHWNLQGQADGFGDKGIGLFLFPAIILFVALLFIYIPKFDPLGKNIHKFQKYYDNFALIILLFMLYVQNLSILYNSPLGYTFNFGQLLIPAFALLFFYTGILVEHAEPSWFVGIRTPWTLSSERVWRKTHKIGANLFKAGAVASLIGIAFPEMGFWVIVALALSIVVFSFVYSYMEFQKEKKESRGSPKKRRK